MAPFGNAMAVFKLLEKSNCRNCNEPTCLAFAAAVFQGRRQLAECPRLSSDTIGSICGAEGGTAPAANGQDGDNTREELQERIRGLDLAEAARRLGAVYDRGRLTLKVLGKDFSVDGRGNLYSDIHIHNWVAVPFLDHVLHGAGTPPSGRWVPLRELPHGRDWYRLFGQRCEKPLQRVADIYTDLFEEMVDLFAGRQVARHSDADVSLVLSPLPLLPMLICYWKPDEGMGSSLNLFFDALAEEQLSIESLYSLGAGLTRMFEKIALRHGYK